MKIDIPAVLLHLRAQAVAATRPPAERAVMRAAAWVFRGPRRFALAQRARRLAQRPFARSGSIRRLPPAARRLDASARPQAARADRASATGGAGGERRRDEVLARVRGRARRAPRPGARSRALPAARDALDRRSGRALLRAGRRVSRRGRAVAPPPSAAAVERSSRAHGARLVVPAGLRPQWRPRGVQLVEDDGLTPHELDTLDGVAHRQHGRDRRDGHDRARRGARRGTARDHARARPPHLRGRGGADRRARARGDAPRRGRSSATATSADVRLGAVRHLRHRAQPRRGRPRPARRSSWSSPSEGVRAAAAHPLATDLAPAARGRVAPWQGHLSDEQGNLPPSRRRWPAARRQRRGSRGAHRGPLRSGHGCRPHARPAPPRRASRPRAAPRPRPAPAAGGRDRAPVRQTASRPRSGRSHARAACPSRVAHHATRSRRGDDHEHRPPLEGRRLLDGAVRGDLRCDAVEQLPSAVRAARAPVRGR